MNTSLFSIPQVIIDDQLSVEDGLSQNLITSIQQDDSGFMWFGTQDGLNRYDGKKFKKLTKKPFEKNTLSHEYVFNITPRKSGGFYVGTHSGLNVVEDGSFSTTVINSFDKESIFSLLELKDSRLLVSSNSGIWLVEIDGERQKIAGELRIRSFKYYDDSRVLFTKDSTIYSIDVSTKKIVKIVRFKEQIVDFCIDHYKNIIIVTPSKISKVSDLHTIRTVVEDQDVRFTCISYFNEKQFWIGTYNSGVFLYNEEFTNKTAILLKAKGRYGVNGKVNLIFKGYGINEDVIWIGTRESGIFKYCKSKNLFKRWHDKIDNPSASNNSYFTMAKAKDGSLWAGTYDGIVQFMGDHYKSYKIAQNKRPYLVQSILIDSKDNFWVGTDKGLFRKINDQFVEFDIGHKIDHTKLPIFKIVEDQQGFIWVSAGGHLLCIHGNRIISSIDYMIIDQQKVEFKAIGNFAFDKEGNIWMGTSNGLFVKMMSGKNLRFVYDENNKNGLMDNIILGVLCDTKNNIWLGSFKGLTKVSKMNGDYHFKHYNESDGLPNSVVYGGVEAENGSFWFSTNSGLFKLEKEKVSTYSSDDGIGITEFNSGAFYKSNGGEIFFGGSGGVVSFNSSIDHRNLHMPRPVLINLTIGGIDQDLNTINKSINLSYRVSNIRFVITATDYTNPSKNSYAYRIKNVSEDWIYIRNSNEITLDQLSAGKYTIEFKCANNFGVWNEKEILTYFLEVKPPFWKTKFFFVMVTMLCLGSIFIWHRIKVSNLLAVESAKHAENDRVRKLTAQDIHDDFGNSLTRISLLTLMAKENLKRKNDSEAILNLDKIYDASQRTYQGTKDFIWAMNAEHDNLLDIMIRIRDYCDDFIDKNTMSFECDGFDSSLKEIKLPSGHSRQLVMILKEAVSNSIKHSKASVLVLSYEFRDEKHLIVWRDNGIGMTSSSNDGQGLKNMMNRASNIGVDLEIIVRKPSGFEIKLSL